MQLRPVTYMDSSDITIEYSISYSNFLTLLKLPAGYPRNSAEPSHALQRRPSRFHLRRPREFVRSLRAKLLPRISSRDLEHQFPASAIFQPPKRCPAQMR